MTDPQPYTREQIEEHLSLIEHCWKHREFIDPATILLHVIADIRMKTGVREKPMLAELADAIVAKHKAELAAIEKERDEAKEAHEAATHSASLLATQADAWIEVFRMCVVLGFDPCKADTGLDGVKEFVRGLHSKVTAATTEADALAARAADIFGMMNNYRMFYSNDPDEPTDSLAAKMQELGLGNINKNPEWYADIAAAVARAKREREGKT